MRLDCRNGLRCYYDEVHPGKYFKNIPQEYMKRRLLLDIDLDAQALLDEWYRLAVGSQAALLLAEYFQVWETFWTTRVHTTDWFRERIDGDRVAPFPRRRDSDYLDALTMDVVTTSEALLKQVVALAETDWQKARARFFRDSFAMAKEAFFLPYLSFTRLKSEKASIQRVRQLQQFHFEESFEGWGTWKRTHGTAKALHDHKEG